jgi:hypothetical protein
MAFLLDWVDDALLDSCFASSRYCREGLGYFIWSPGKKDEMDE